MGVTSNLSPVITKISPKLMGPRLAKILETICDTYQQYTNLSVLSVIQSRQVEGLNFCRIKKMKLDKVTKHGNEIMICFNTTLESNNLNLKKSQIVFQFKRALQRMSQQMTSFLTSVVILENKIILMGA